MEQSISAGMLEWGRSQVGPEHTILHTTRQLGTRGRHGTAQAVRQIVPSDWLPNTEFCVRGKKTMDRFPLAPQVPTVVGQTVTSRTTGSQTEPRVQPEPSFVSFLGSGLCPLQAVSPRGRHRPLVHYPGSCATCHERIFFFFFF